MEWPRLARRSENHVGELPNRTNACTWYTKQLRRSIVVHILVRSEGKDFFASKKTRNKGNVSPVNNAY